MARPLLVLVAACAVHLLAWSGDVARADDPGPCSAERAGLVACVAGKLCACGRSGPAFRWDCGVLRPGCGDPYGAPATIDPYAYPLPPALGLGNRERSPRR